jgi:hypothetical protein
MARLTYRRIFANPVFANPVIANIFFALVAVLILAGTAAAQDRRQHAPLSA